MSDIIASNAALHQPVLLSEVVTALSPRDGAIYVDGTFGAGGFSRAFLGNANCRVFVLDRRPDSRAGAPPPPPRAAPGRAPGWAAPPGRRGGPRPRPTRAGRARARPRGPCQRERGGWPAARLPRPSRSVGGGLAGRCCFLFLW